MNTTFTKMAIFSLLTFSSVAFNNAQADVSQSYSTGNEVSSFCRDRLAVLKLAYRKAEIESQSGNISNSVSTLENGLLNASLRINPNFNNTLTTKSIRRGITLLNELKATRNDKQKARALNNFLFNYYLFIENVSNNLDVPFYSYKSGFSSSLNSNTQFEKLFINFAKEQVNLILKSMTVTDGSGAVYPLGSPDMLLTALRTTASFMSNDLSESMFAYRYACTINSLDEIVNDIQTYVQTRATYPDDFVATQEIVRSIQQTIRGSVNCQTNNNSNVGTTTDAIRYSFRLSDGTVEQVKLNEYKYIKKIIISAEGLGSDATFDVVVNGDVKGTVYVPRRDPSYFVTIEDSADSIELVSRGGTALISRILVVTE